MGTLEFVCGAIDGNGIFSREFTGRGKNISPEFAIKNLSLDARSLIVTLEDMSHPIKQFTHWVIWNIPAADVIPEAVPRGKYVQGIAYGYHRYAGPKPPRGKTHRYRFTIYALDCFLELGAFSFKRTVLKAASGHIIQRGEVCGYFE